MRRLPRRALASAALVLLTAGCTTFSDVDVVARVGDAELSQDQLDDRLAELGIVADETALPSVFARESISSWIEEEAIGQGLFGEETLGAVSAEAITAGYDLGLDAAGVTCPALIITETVELAEDAVVRLDGGEDFATVFVELNTDPNLGQTGGEFACVRRSELSPDILDTPDVRALRSISAEAPHASAEIPVGDGSIGIVVAFRPYDALDDQERAAVDAAVAPRVLLEDIDIHVDPRYGRFDPASGAVVDME